MVYESFFNNRFRLIFRKIIVNNLDIKRLCEISICFVIDNVIIDYRFKLIVDIYFYVCKGIFSKVYKNSCILYIVNVYVKIKCNVCLILFFFKLLFSVLVFL